jgi:hypothetical protein
MRSTDFPFAVTPQRLQRGGRPDYSAPSAALAAVRADDDQQFGGISARDTSLRDQIKDKLAVIVGRRNADKLLGVGELLGADAPLMLDDARLAYREGRPGEAAATAALAVLPIPGAAKKGIKAAAKGAKAAAPSNLLSMSEASRMARAAEQKYMQDRFWHGRDTPSQSEPKGSTTFYSRDPEYAAGFARDGGSVYEYRIRPQKMMPAGKVNFGTAADIIEGLIKAEDESGAARVMSGLVDFPGTPQQFVAAARRAPENSLGVSAAAIQHLLSKNANTTWESALRSAGFDAYDTGRDVVMLTQKGQRRVDAAFDPEQIEATGVTKARGGLAVFKGVAPFAVRG